MTKKDLERLECGLYQLMPSHKEMYHYSDYETRTKVILIGEMLKLVDEMTPVLPKDIAKWLDNNIDNYKSVYSFIISTVEVYGDTIPDYVWNFSTKYPDTMAKAYLIGYRTEDSDDKSY